MLRTGISTGCMFIHIATFRALNNESVDALHVDAVILRYPLTGAHVPQLPANVDDGNGQQFTVVFLDPASDIIGFDFLPPYTSIPNAPIGNITRRLSELLAESGWWCRY